MRGTMNYKIIQGDCREALKQVADESVNTCVTSPPYFGLRSYSDSELEIGKEDEVEAYVQALVEVFREVKRVLRDDGTLWLNLGDSYASNGCYINAWLEKEHNKGKKHLHVKNHERYRDRKAVRGGEYGIKAKDLIGIPWRVAFALQADGWYLRQDIIWAKPNPMPESVGDRCTKAHEYIFLLSKKSHYYYDHEAIKETSVSGKEKKNKRSVWTVNTKGYKGAHFAVYPKDLILPCILAGTSAHGCCSKCGAPYKQVVNHPGNPLGILGHKGIPNVSNTSGSFIAGDKVTVHTENGIRLKKGHNPTQYSKSQPTDEWVQTCNCKDVDVVPCTVLDPFTGSGTTAVVSLQNKRNFVGCELNPDYAALAESRIKEEVTQDLSSLIG
jgi:DNA modification methylase